MNTTTAVTTPGDTAVRNVGNDRSEPALVPPVDVIEDSTGITLYADLPGVPRDRLNLRVEGDTLSLEGEMQLALPQGMTPSHAEVQLSRFRRTFTLSKELDPDKVSAELTHGVLRVRIPKAEHAQPRRVEVRVA
ncbi:MAG: Hsp20/alpha crystallin family protein [Caldimonas sp.]|jgi:HSP20 family protein|uniref:Hsp20/alpha crystallin family protein n=1 Tax=Caldimonas sp. TaxID=2838790 RepID=UPI00391897C0